MITQGRRNRCRSIGYCDFLLVIHGNYGPVSYCFQDKRRFQWKIANFATPCIFNDPAEGLPLEFCNGVGLKNLNGDDDDGKV